MILLIMIFISPAYAYDPIQDNNMKAYVWSSDAEDGWPGFVEQTVVKSLTEHGFNVTFEIAPQSQRIYEMIEDPNVKIYYGLGHGSDKWAGTGSGRYYASYFGDHIRDRKTPLTIGVFQHCGAYECYTPRRWLQESTQGNNNVVAQRYWGEGWCGFIESPMMQYIDCEDCLNMTMVAPGYGQWRVLDYIDLGYTYADAVKLTRLMVGGKKQGNMDLRYPQFCGDVNYDMAVNETDVSLLKAYLNDTVNYSIHSDWDADVNGDMAVDRSDLWLLEKHVNDPDSYPLYPRGWFITQPQPKNIFNGTIYENMTEDELNQIFSEIEEELVAPGWIFHIDTGDYMPSESFSLWEYMTPTKNQGRCGACSIFAAIGAIEGTYMIEIGEEIDLSEQHLLCNYTGIRDVCGHGIAISNVVNHLKQGKPIASEGDMPYNASKEGNSCNISDGWRQNAFYIGNATAYVELEDIELMYLLEHEGKPFTAAINVHYDPKQARCRHNHVVVIVGWLVDEREDFYWIFKNSWGGNDSYYYPEYAECFNYVIVFDGVHKLDACELYDTNGTPGIQKDEAVNAIGDYLIYHTIEKKVAVEVLKCYFFS